MNSVLFRSMVITSLRDKITLFYSLLLPIALIIGLGMFFDEPLQRLNIVSGITAVSTLFWGMQGIAFQIHLQRSRGVYKLLKLTPMPLLSFITVLVLARTIIGVVIHVVIWLFGIILFGLQLSFILVILTLLWFTLGTICFTSIGVVLGNLARNEAQINMFSNFAQIPMIFMSEVFYSLQAAPAWVAAVGKLLPFEHYVNLMKDAHTLVGTLNGVALMVLVLYTVLALLVAVLTFRWDEDASPRTKRTRRYHVQDAS